MPVRRIRRKFESWRQEPQEVRLRIATLLTAGTGLMGALLWLFVLLPLQLKLSAPSGSDEVTSQLRGAVSGIRDVVRPTPTPPPAGGPTPTPTPEVKYYHDTRPSLQENPSEIP